MSGLPAEIFLAINVVYCGRKLVYLDLPSVVPSQL